ncbi:hypothetical protein [Fulvivirga ligni]|uniref:hypothetical protein n=1 Tax=Fulvivirga ligni TaxID=2904246 RepID=UPI001F16DBE6|nr:hypothetical protein [Fulvivirga ligni]UII22644.1 hypothetical protein LVD16_05315 [Fulvivirga ligni]
MKKVLLLIVLSAFSYLNVIAQESNAPNLIMNSYMDMLGESDVPVGYTPYGGTLNIKAVHPFTKGFEGPYLPSAPSSTASSPDAATESKPYYYGVYNKGPRTLRGGLADGWHYYAGGKILKITGNNSGTHAAVYFPFEKNLLTAKVRFRAWVKISQGTSVSFGSDAGYKFKETGLTITKQTANAATDGWYRIDEIIDVSQFTNLYGFSFSMGVKGSNIEVYLALPYLTNVYEDGWMPSPSDNLARNDFNLVGKKVGIGTLQPDEKLTVNGVIHSKEVKVDTNIPVPDYVFAPEYNLPTLSTIERYIQENHHLPDIPAAKEMEAEGIKVGEMNMLLLKKVEELTLHIIELEKRIKELEKDNQ